MKKTYLAPVAMTVTLSDDDILTASTLSLKDAGGVDDVWSITDWAQNS